MSLLGQYCVGVFGDSHVTRLTLPDSVVVVGKGGELVSNWNEYRGQLQNFDLLVINIGGNDISSKTPFEAPKCTITEAINHIKECYEFAKRHNRVVLTADVLPRLSNWRGSDYLNGRLEKRMRKNHIKYAKDLNLKPQDFDQSGVHLLTYDEVSRILVENIERSLSPFM